MQYHRLALFLALPLALSAQAAEGATATAAPTPDATAEAPAAPGSSLRRFDRRGRRGHGRLGQATPQARFDHGTQRGDPNFDRWAQGQFRTIDQYLLRHDAYNSMRYLRGVRHGTAQRVHLGYRYQQACAELDAAMNAVRYNDFYGARGAVASASRLLAWQGGGGHGPDRRFVVQNLRSAIGALEAHQAWRAVPMIQAAHVRAQRSQDGRLRQASHWIARAQRQAVMNRIWDACETLRRTLGFLRGQGGGGQPADPDSANRAEWRRDIRDLIDTIQDGNIRMAQRDLQTLMRDIRQDGHDWSRNRQYVQKLQFIAPRLQWGNERWCIDQLRDVSRSLDC